MGKTFKESIELITELMVAHAAVDPASLHYRSAKTWLTKNAGDFDPETKDLVLMRFQEAEHADKWTPLQVQHKHLKDWYFDLEDYIETDAADIDEIGKEAFRALYAQLVYTGSAIRELEKTMGRFGDDFQPLDFDDRNKGRVHP